MINVLNKGEKKPLVVIVLHENVINVKVAFAEPNHDVEKSFILFPRIHNTRTYTCTHCERNSR